MSFLTAQLHCTNMLLDVMLAIRAGDKHLSNTEESSLRSQGTCKNWQDDSVSI